MISVASVEAVEPQGGKFVWGAQTVLRPPAHGCSAGSLLETSPGDSVRHGMTAPDVRNFLLSCSAACWQAGSPIWGICMPCTSRTYRFYVYSKRRVVGPLCMHVLTLLCRESCSCHFLLPGYQHDLI